MQPSHSDLLGRRRDDGADRGQQWSLDLGATTRSTSHVPRLRSEDSWVEISSQPSSSSLSSAGDQEVVTAGLQVQHDSGSTRHRRRRVQTMAAVRQTLSHRRNSAGGSSQDEYDESESESDRILSSSNEDINTRSHASSRATAEQGQEEVIEDDEDDSLTALGTATSDIAVFTPQPNAFSHPPPSQGSRRASAATVLADSYFTPRLTTTTAPSSTRPDPSRTQSQRSGQSARPRLYHTRSSSQAASSHSPLNMLTSARSYQPDHDAALRASLSTLLSCAAAVRGSPKVSESSGYPRASRDSDNSAQTTTFRLVPERHFVAEDQGRGAKPAATTRKPQTSLSASSDSVSSLPRNSTTAKRKAREQSKDRHSKKSRSAGKSGWSTDEATISPTLMSWMISAGVVLVFSAISFSAGYAWGKEVGRFEGPAGVGADSSSCAREAMRSGTGLRRLRWSTTSTSATA